MTSNQDPNSKPLTWSEKRAIYLSQAQNDPSSTPASTSTPTSLANQADSPQPSHKSPAIPPRLQGADDPNFLNQIGSKQGNNSNGELNSNRVKARTMQDPLDSKMSVLASLPLCCQLFLHTSCKRRA